MGPSGKLSGYGYLRGKNGNVCGGGRGKRSSTGVTSVVKALMESQVTGKGLKSIRQLPRVVYCRFQTSSKNMAPLCMDLENGLVSNHVEACQRVLSNLLYSICEWNNPHYQQNREAFVLFGGDVLLLRALFYPFSSEDGIEKLGSSKVLAVRRDCLSLLRELCFTVPFFPEGLAANGDFVIKLFAFMGNITTFDQAVSLAEDVLAAREDTLRVQDIPDFANLVRNFSSRQLASFCRVLAMVAFESEAGNPWMGQERSVENTFPLQRPRSEEPEWTVADKNHDAILLIPDILERLVMLLTFDKVPFGRERLQGVLSSEISDLTATVYVEGVPENTFIASTEGRRAPHDETRIVHPFAENGSRVDPASHAHQRVVATIIDEDFLDWNVFLDRSPSTTALVLNHHVEVLFVLCALCGGKKREQVQNYLAELGLVGVLNDMFDKLDWMVTKPRVNRRGIHGYGCACNPKSALKIQFLRLIHNFCDRDSCNRANKQLLLQPSSSKDGSYSWNRVGEYKEPEGLMVKILKVLINEPADSLYRFWLASCVEAFLRGADSKDQEFVASTGLMEHLVNEILKGGFRCSTSLQIDFDLLGELIKFNKSLFRDLNGYLAGEKFNVFVEVLVTNLVDSNVFVRSVILSLDFFKRSRQIGTTVPSAFMPTNSENYKFGDTPWSRAKGENEFCMITAFVSHNTLRLLRDLMCSVRLSDINQDNICVLNTALIFLIFAEKNGELQGYLQALRAADMRVLRTFRALLEFWRSYYLWKRGRECVSLQYSTHLPFADWLRIVDCLCSHPDSPYSLLHTPPVGAQSCVALTASSAPHPRRR
ncbi:uncharacterized protein [Physcomitrium patens]|uniref:Uncharacterized protein n=3 Tax=Physcomitrium patens TaxID=3218 RepID=A0A7I4E4Q4_PHYPA|nr:short transient receptor potential channel 4-associated protein-like isoform X1 [Physcomitrium patens]|eukprot:XP_024378941.1 short transient receptor potential channel 4-associated protein-like isoform X1 [Physcomitrella patens]